MERTIPHTTLLIFGFLACAVGAFASCPTAQAKDEKTLLQQEETWAKTLDEHDAAVIECLLAAEFQDADTNGALHERTEVLARISHRRPGSNHLEDMKARIYGNTAFVRGLNRILDPSGKVVASVRFDLFVYRDGRWQAIAGQETFVNEKEK